MNRKIINSDTKNQIATSYSQDEKELRKDLAAACRLIHYYGMADMIYGHASLRINENPTKFIMNPYGLTCDEVCASNLVAVDVNGKKINPTDVDISKSAFNIDSPIHLSRSDAKVILHTHTVAGMAIAAMEEGLLPLNQISMAFYNRIAYHDYEGISFNSDESE